MVCHRLLLPSVLLLLLPSVWAVLCPGGKEKCGDGMTCCPLANHEFGCCPYPEALCCPDHVHCCPHGMKCDERHQACLKNGFPALFFAPISVKPELVEEVMPESDYGHLMHSVKTNHIDEPREEHDGKDCPDGHECPSSFTCCKMFRGSYGCCPYSDAKCCMDGFHCCPHGSQCDPDTGGCLHERNWLGKAASLIKVRKPSTPEPLEVADPGGKCPDGHPCLEKFTCCKVESGGYGCCPYTDANCCTDLIHCCPKNTNCNTTLGTCDVERAFSVPAFSFAAWKLSDAPPLSAASPPLSAASPPLSAASPPLSAASPPLSAASPAPVAHADDFAPNGLCPDQKSKCDPGNTCCQILDGSYGCCPFAEATCCTDHASCCPGGYQCAADGMCERVVSLAALPFLPPINVHLKSTAAPSESSPVVKAEDTECPDSTMCPDQATCCNVTPTSYGCCPMSQATCCGDMQHCCPHGYWCSDEGCDRMQGGTLNLTRIVHTLEFEFPKVMLAP